MLTEMASRESGTASDSSNISCTVGSFVGGAIGSLLEQNRVLRSVQLLQEEQQVTGHK